MAFGFLKKMGKGIAEVGKGAGKVLAAPGKMIGRNLPTPKNIGNVGRALGRNAPTPKNIGKVGAAIGKGLPGKDPGFMAHIKKKNPLVK